MARVGLNGNLHDPRDFDLDEAGIKYNGDGKWTLQEGMVVQSMGGDDWLITLADGTELFVWTEE